MATVDERLTAIEKRLDKLDGGASVPVPLFSDDFMSGTFKAWTTAQWRGRNSPAKDAPANEYQASVIDYPGRGRVARFELRNGDIPPWGGGERTELTSNVTVKSGEQRSFRFDTFFDSTFPASVGWGCLFWQIHPDSSTASPPICLDIAGENIVLANNNSQGYTRTQVQRITRGVWQHWEINVLFSSDPKVGWAEVKIDDKIVVPKHSRSTLFDTGGYMKMGLYRDPASTKTAILMLDNVQVY